MPRVRGSGAFVGLLVGMGVVGLVEWRIGMAYLWLNVDRPQGRWRGRGWGWGWEEYVKRD